MEIINKFKPTIFSHSYWKRSFSTFTKNNNIKELEINNLDQDNIDYNSDKSLKKQLKEFKKAYGGGYLGYKNVFYLGTVVYDSKIKDYFTITNFENKIIEYLNEIPEDVIYSVLPFIRWHDSKGNYRTLTISKSIKINKNTSKKLIANKLEQDLNEILKTYELANKTMDFYLMSRPWLKSDDFNMDEAGLTNIFNEQLERELSTWSEQDVNSNIKKNFYEKANSLKDYSYKNIFINKYGEPLLDKIII